MAYKEGVEVERVMWFRGLIDVAKDLDSKMVEGELTPDEAFNKLSETMDQMGAKPEKKAEPPKAEKASYEVPEESDHRLLKKK